MPVSTGTAAGGSGDGRNASGGKPSEPSIPRRWRSLLFVPGDAVDKLEKAWRGDADAVIIDLEDGVGPHAKNVARDNLLRGSRLARNSSSGFVVRVNSGERSIGDICAAVAAGADAIMLPKVETVRELHRVTYIIEREPRARPDCVKPALIALIETPAGLLKLASIVRAAQLAAVALGTEDFARALGRPPTPSTLQLPSQMIALAAATRGLMALSMPISIAEFRDMAAWESAARNAYAAGNSGGLCIHPRQVAICNKIFSPCPEALSEARAVCHKWEDAQRKGLAVTALEGRMIDLPVFERAAELVRQWEEQRLA